jgi:methylglutaconyl-CoA hydratase
MGERLARRYFLSGEKIDAGEAYRLRLLSDVAPAEELDGALNALLGHLVSGGRAAQAKIKDLLRTVAAGPVDDALIAETAKRIAEIRVSPEGREGIASFLEKRKPAWVKEFEAVQVKPPRKKRK